LLRLNKKYAAPDSVKNMTAEQFFQSDFLHDARGPPLNNSKNGYEEFYKVFK
jgi:hypothetical protein